MRYSVINVAGKGSFGTVYKAEEMETGRVVAVKKVFQDKMYKNRELIIMKRLQHPNIVRLLNSFYSDAENGENLNLVMEFIPDCISHFNSQYLRNNKVIPMIFVKLYSYQMLRGLAYLHSFDVCHRDIKPQNLLLDRRTHVVKICDFGSAKQLVAGEPNVSYICSRYYRAPELIFGASDYSIAVDLWSIACVIAELLKGTPLFRGDNNVTQLVEIFKLLGTPTRDQISAMNKSHQDFVFPSVDRRDWRDVFTKRDVDEAMVDLLERLFQYDPRQRISAKDALGHRFFDELRATTILPDGSTLPPDLFVPIPGEFDAKQL